MPPPKTGPLTQSELLGVWQAAVDRGYSDPLIAAGDGNGLEYVGQMLEQLARASTGIDVTMQSLFITPWSGQSNPPAAGAANATVTLTFERHGLLDKPLLLAAGSIFIEEQTTDWGDPVGEVVTTGRLYTLAEDLVFHPGDVGPFDVAAIADRPGNGYNNPLPGTIRFLHQPGAVFTNDLATVKWTPQATVNLFPPSLATVVAAPQADMFVPEHVGQQVLFTSGVNAGRVGRITTFGAPAPPLAGSSVTLEVLHSFEAFVFAGLFLAGETINFDNGGPVVGIGRVVGARIVSGHQKVSYVLMSGVEGANASGATSGATAGANSPLFRQLYATEIGTAAWRILGWETDWRLTATNTLSPTGGRLAMLDALGRERAKYRAPREGDDSYRKRVAEIADVVSPNAIRRALYRVLGTTPFCFREVGMAEFPGFFFDGDGSVPSAVPHGGANDAYDTDVVVFSGVMTSGAFQDQEPAQLETMTGNLLKVGGYFGRIAGGVTLTLIRKTGIVPTSMLGLQVRGLISGATFAPGVVVVTPTVNARRFHELLDYAEFRAFFLVGLPRSNAGEFGFAYDTFPTNAYDASPYSAFYDGSPEGAAAFYRNVFQAVDTTRAGGVGFNLYLEDIGCP